MRNSTDTRLLLDLTTIANYSGQADGISRTLRNFAFYAVSHIGEVNFFYIAEGRALSIDKQLASLVLDGTYRIDSSYFTDPEAKPRFRERLHPALKRVVLWIQRPRRQALLFLERMHFKNSRLAPLAMRLKPMLLNERYRKLLTGPNGQAVRLVPHDLAFTQMSEFTENDIIVFAGANWTKTHDFVLKLRVLPRIAVLWYDLIPVLFPQFFDKRLVESFRRYFHVLAPRTELLLFNTQQIRDDAEKYCSENQLPFRESAVVHLGADPLTKPAQESPLIDGLRTGAYALFVSTVEPRKGHRLLFEVWKKLLAENVPQHHDFQLVFVGRKGWMVDDLIKEIEGHSSFGRSIRLLSNVDDAALYTLYENCAFTVYPSLYEGFGLPIVESFSHHKAVLASSAGALAETVGGYSACLSPYDETAWLDTLREWITEPTAYKVYEDRIKSTYHPRSWTAAAEDFFQAIDRQMTQAVRP